MPPARPIRIGVLVFDDADELDVVGPYQVLTSWAERSALRPEVLTLSTDGLGVRLSHGLLVVPERSADEVGRLHVLVHPGGPGARRLARDGAHLQWVRSLRPATALMTAVCTGSLVYAAAGLLGGRPATTHRSAFDELAELEPAVLLDTEARFVDDGDVITSAGTTAGIDLALHLVERLESAEQAAAVRRGLEYDPRPPR